MKLFPPASLAKPNKILVINQQFDWFWLKTNDNGGASSRVFGRSSPRWPEVTRKFFKLNYIFFRARSRFTLSSACVCVVFVIFVKWQPPFGAVRNKNNAENVVVVVLRIMNVALHIPNRRRPSPVTVVIHGRRASSIWNLTWPAAPFQLTPTNFQGSSNPPDIDGRYAMRISRLTPLSLQAS